MKRILALLLSVTMVLCFMPSIAFATDTTTAEQITSAINDGGTITLNNDVEMSLPNQITKDVTIDLNKCKLTLDNTRAVIIKDGGKLTIKNGSIDALKYTEGTTSVFSIESSSSIYFDGVTADTKGTMLYPRGDAAKVDVKDSKIYCGVYAVATNAGKVDNYYIQINLTDSTFESKYGYKNNDGDSCPVIINVPGKLTMDGCTVKGSRQGVIVRGGTASIKNSTIELAATYTKGKDMYLSKNWGSGDEVPMAALVVGNRGDAYKYPATCTLENTKVKATTDYKAVYAYQMSETGRDVTLKVSGTETKVEGEFACCADNEAKAAVSITGGAFSSNPTDYVPEGYEVKESNNIWTVSKKQDTPAGGGGGGAILPPPEEPTGPQTNTETKPDGSTVTTTTDKDKETGVEIKTEVVKDASGTATATAEVNAPTAVTVAGSTATVTVSQDVTDKIIEQAKSAEKAAADAGADKVESVITLNAGTTSSVDKVEVALPAETLTKIVNETSADVVVATPVGEIKLDQQVLETIADKAVTGEVKITADVVDTEKLPEKVQEQLGNNAMVIDLSIETANGKVSSFNGGTATITVPVPADVKDAVALYVKSNGNVEKIKYTVVNVNGKESIQFETGHFSYYAVMSQDDAEKAVKATNIKLAKGVKNTRITVKSSAGKGFVKVSWAKKGAYKLDGYKVYRAKSKNGKFTLKKTTSSTSYKNTKLKRGSTYYYKVRGYRVIDGKRVYTGYSKVIKKQVK